MEKKKFWLLLFIIGIISAASGQAGQTQASEFTKENALTVVENAFRTQVSLSEKPQSQEKIEGKLSKYLTADMTESFMSENVYKIDGGFITFGSDFASYYIPFFSYDESTNVKYINGHWYIWEERTNEEEGPIESVEGIEAVVLSEEEGTWKVSAITYDVPDFVQSR
ncbi:DUF3993 domain-containing protein [Rossellomorea aquimaris]|uniref:DUF3993 domain-containing protein n=1 Tax=Rossellomorea aquimaris TaxID=189382 RepID=UPI001CD362CC|nr:DUF3993 domain-containing protein [Rossellomorea aquimaris]MCA1059360.1 DUF3993 domain-containing protein [Rossellomorea aquimaris]